jgi:GNAT superfamily N-acetyltransferase
MQIREFDAARDLAFLRRCVIEIQEIERGIDSRLPFGRGMVDAYCHTLLERCARWRGVMFIAEEANRPVGLLSMFLEVPQTEPDEPAANYALISDLVVLQEARRKGVGSELLLHGEEHARAHGAEILRMEVMAENSVARRFYDRRGWKDRVIQLEKPLGPQVSGRARI